MKRFSFAMVLAGLLAVAMMSAQVTTDAPVAQRTSAVPATQAPAVQPATRSTATTGGNVTGGNVNDGFSQRLPRYEISAGDAMDIAFEFSPEYNQSVTVQPDGFVTLKGVGDVHVAGLTVPQLTRTLHDHYNTFLNDPAVSIVLKDFNKPYFTASGFVTKPGKYDLRADTTLVEALAIAGGFAEGAKNTQVLLFRKVSDQWLEAKLIDVKNMLNGRSLKEDIHLKPGDMIFVPQNRMSKVRRFFPNTGMGISPHIP